MYYLCFIYVLCMFFDMTGWEWDGNGMGTGTKDKSYKIRILIRN